ncbi:hypothetical protein P9875_12000 [Janthinobacterium rivuli]|uniref:Uncharacterized protein n=1 Tax=Janthinobacterium rivuli TaxID=2751478 RepID=A0ABY8IA95_9BURK|nr:hypothetical protein [Janthinobacterium rivuli]WFR81825.1 hypothetical protein P9875_12000 [Janthinobacterium rivuli]
MSNITTQGGTRAKTRGQGRVMPPQTHHQHSNEQGQTPWRLIVSPH